jgi:hypothetical protein
MTTLLEAQTKRTTIETYSTLRRAVKVTLLQGQKRIEEEKVKTYWNTGRLINEHVKHIKQTDLYRETIIRRLGNDLDMDTSVLNRVSKFHRLFPRTAGRQLLNWSHYRALMTLEDNKLRTRLHQKAIENNWTGEYLERYVKENWPTRQLIGRRTASLSQASGTPLSPERGTVYTYRFRKQDTVHQEKDALVLDLGFSSYKFLNEKESRKFRTGEIVESRDSVLHKSKRTEADLFTYHALEVVKTPQPSIIPGEQLPNVRDPGPSCLIPDILNLRLAAGSKFRDDKWGGVMQESGRGKFSARVLGQDGCGASFLICF